MTDGQGEIRTLDTLAGMPVFETGAFNHSATCPGCDTKTNRVFLSHTPLRFEETRQQLGTRIGEDSTLDFRRVIQSRITKEISD